MTREPNSAVIEIVETRGDSADAVGGLIKPNEVRINGQKLWVPKGEPIKVHAIEMNGPDGEGDEVLQVTLTLWARRVFMGHASESPERDNAEDTASDM